MARRREPFTGDRNLRYARRRILQEGPEVCSLEELWHLVLHPHLRSDTIAQGWRPFLGMLTYTVSSRAVTAPFLQQNFHWSETFVSRVLAILELGRRLYSSSRIPPVIRTPEDVYQITRHMAYLPQENLRGLYLDSRHRVCDDRILSVGTVNASYAHPREILGPAVENRAVAFLLVHNHPSGDPQPSPEDHRLTEQILHAARILEIAFLDHIIIGDHQYFSFRRDTRCFQG